MLAFGPGLLAGKPALITGVMLPIEGLTLDKGHLASVDTVEHLLRPREDARTPGSAYRCGGDLRRIELANRPSRPYPLRRGADEQPHIQPSPPFGSSPRRVCSSARAHDCADSHIVVGVVAWLSGE